MKQLNFKEKIEIPEGIELKVDGSKVILKGSAGEVSKLFKMPSFSFVNEGNSLVVACDFYGVRNKQKFFTIKAHIKNMIKGCQEGYIYLLKICSSHFPMNVSVSGNKLQIKNLLGEKVPRELILKEGADVKINGEIIEVTGTDKELVSQVAADIEILTKVKNKDRRIFQDGIYITSKDGKPVA